MARDCMDWDERFDRVSCQGYRCEWSCERSDPISPTFDLDAGGSISLFRDAARTLNGAAKSVVQCLLWHGILVFPPKHSASVATADFQPSRVPFFAVF